MPLARHQIIHAPVVISHASSLQCPCSISYIALRGNYQSIPPHPQPLPSRPNLLAATRQTPSAAPNLTRQSSLSPSSRLPPRLICAQPAQDGPPNRPAAATPADADPALPLQGRQDPRRRVILGRQGMRPHRYGPVLCGQGHQQAPHGRARAHG